MPACLQMAIHFLYSTSGSYSSSGSPDACAALWWRRALSRAWSWPSRRAETFKSLQLTVVPSKQSRIGLRQSLPAGISNCVTPESHKEVGKACREVAPHEISGMRRYLTLLRAVAALLLGHPARHQVFLAHGARYRALPDTSSSFMRLLPYTLSSVSNTAQMLSRSLASFLVAMAPAW
jgi:hypothetical protein